MAAPRSSPLFRLLTPLLQSFRPAVPAQSIQNAASRPFSNSAPAAAVQRGSMNPKALKNRPKKDQRITLIRYHLQHPKTPRPLRFSRLRALRHWTIHRAWMLFRRNYEAAQELELQRMYKSMHNACEELRHLQGPGDKDAGRLYRIAMEKKGIFGANGVPIEYARAQVETPGREPWDHSWTR